MMQRRMMETRTMYRSVKYRVNRDKDTRTADPSSCNFRIKRNSCLQSTMAKTYGSQFPSINLTIDFSQPLNQNLNGKPTYLQSFNSLMETSEKNINKRKIKMNKIESIREGKDFAFFRQSKQIVRIKDRIVIPDFQKKEKEVEDSEHHLLAPFNTPFSHVKLMTQNAQTELKNQKHQVRQIKAGLQQVKKTTMQNLDGINHHFQEQIKIIRGILRKNQIQQQEKKLKTKRELDELNNQHNENKSKFNELHDRNCELQVSIFNSTPYNLQVETKQARQFSMILEQQPGEVGDYQSRLYKKMRQIQGETEPSKLELFYV